MLLWGPPVLLCILFLGMFFTVRGRGMQLWRLPLLWPEALRGEKRPDGRTVSAVQALSAALAGSLGTGNIAGVAAALCVGGPGTVVWMWIAAFFGMMTVYGENFLAAKYSTEKMPGAVGYIRKALGTPAAKLYAAGCVLSALGMGSMAQTGAVSAACSAAKIPNRAAGLMTALLLLLCVRGGLKKAVKITEKLVPFMAGLFLLCCAAVLFLQRERIPSAAEEMLRGAFSLRAAGGAGVWLAMREGISRGVFSNEAGLGSGSFALCRTAGKTPEQVGALGALQVAADTLLLCPVTALALLVSPGTGDGADRVLSAFSAVLGPCGRGAAAVSMALFAFAAVIAWTCYGMDALRYLAPSAGRAGRRLYLCAAAAACFFGCVLPFSGVLTGCDLANGVMAIPNLLALFRLSGEIFEKNGGKQESFCRKFKQNAKKL